MRGSLVSLGIEVAAVAVLLVGGSFLPDAAVRPPQPPAGVSKPPPETKDRTPEERLEALVAAPMALVRAGRRREADAAFEELLSAARARGDKVGAADLLTAYGVELYKEGYSGTLADRRAAIPWLERAVTAAREAWGPVHPETALALEDLAEVLQAVSDGAPSPEAARAFREALEIRRATLGPDNRETLATMSAFAELLTTEPLDEARLAEARSLYTSLVGPSSSPRSLHPLEQRVKGWVGLAWIEARAGHQREALAELERARDEYRANARAEDARGACFALAKGRERLEKMFEAQHAAGAARAAAQLFPPDATMRCLVGEF